VGDEAVEEPAPLADIDVVRVRESAERTRLCPVAAVKADELVGSP
jgi:hypothetical protein